MDLNDAVAAYVGALGLVDLGLVLSKRSLLMTMMTCRVSHRGRFGHAGASPRLMSNDANTASTEDILALEQF